MAVTDGDLARFCDKVFTRSRQLVSTGVWSGVELSRLDSWLRAHADYNCQLLSAGLLDHLSYRSRPQFLALLENLVLTLRLPGIARGHDAQFIETMGQRSDPGVRFAPVISPDQPPTKSGPYVLRLMQRQFRMRDQWLIWPERAGQVPENVRFVFLLDDFTGTGEQFCEFWKSQGLGKVMLSRPNLKFVLMAAAIHETGLARIRREIPGLNVVYSELLGPQHHFGVGTVLDYYREPLVKEMMLKQLHQMCDQHGIGGSMGVYGFGDLGLCYAFEHATPNNTLPIYWYDSDNWSPLLSR